MTSQFRMWARGVVVFGFVVFAVGVAATGSFAQEKKLPQTAGVDYVKMGLNRALV